MVNFAYSCCSNFRQHCGRFTLYFLFNSIRLFHLSFLSLIILHLGTNELVDSGQASVLILFLNLFFSFKQPFIGEKSLGFVLLSNHTLPVFFFKPQILLLGYTCLQLFSLLSILFSLYWSVSIMMSCNYAYNHLQLFCISSVKF